MIQIPAIVPGFYLWASRLSFTRQPDDQLSRPGDYLDILSGLKAQRFQPAALDGELGQRVRLAPVRPVSNSVIMRGGCGRAGLWLMMRVSHNQLLDSCLWSAAAAGCTPLQPR